MENYELLANQELAARVAKYEIRKHEGLWRFYKDKLWIPMKKEGKYKINDKNLKSGRVFIKKYSPMSGKKPEIIQKEYSRNNPWTPEIAWYQQTHWAYNEDTGEVFRWVLTERGASNEWKAKTLIGKVQPHMKPEAVLAQILDKDITVRDEYTTQDKHRRPKQVGAADVQLVKWCREFDGKNILALVIAKPKMTYAEIKNVIVNEGGSVGADGIIHRD